MRPQIHAHLCTGKNCARILFSRVPTTAEWYHNVYMTFKRYFAKSLNVYACWSTAKARTLAPLLLLLLLIVRIILCFFFVACCDVFCCSLLGRCTFIDTIIRYNNHIRWRARVILCVSQYFWFDHRCHPALKRLNSIFEPFQLGCLPRVNFDAAGIQRPKKLIVAVCTT